MEDIAPKLLEAIRKDFINILGDAKVKELNYPAAGDYAEEVGAALAEAFHRNLDPGQLPDGKMLWNIADRVIRPMLEQDHKIVSDAAVMVQEALNKAAGIGLKAQRAPLDQDRVSGILNRLVSAEHFAEIAWILDEPIKTFSRSVVDDTIRENAEFHSRAGLHPRIIRTAEHKCCEWCSRLAGVYEYPYDVPEEVYQRHRCCRCIVDYHPGEGKKVQNVHTKMWRDYEKINSRKNMEGVTTIGHVRTELIQEFPENVFTEYIKKARPGKGSIQYDDGFDRSKHKEEIEIARWIQKNLGGDITLLQESVESGVKTPDYIWNNKFWDLKCTTTEKAADSAIRHGIKQIMKNPGGIILNYGNHSVNLEQVITNVSNRLKRSKFQMVDIMIISKEKIVKVLRYKK